MDFFATAAKGTEPPLKSELRELGLSGVRADRGGVHFGGAWEAAMKVCLWSRIAMRVFVRLRAFPAEDADSLYAGVRAIDWREHLSPRHTLAVRATGRAKSLTHAGFVAQKTKDAIVDRIRDEAGARPSVDVDDPDVLVAVHLARGQAEVHLDVGGAALYARGWRAMGGDAPLRETLAAAVVRLSGWDRTRPLVDPMCGSGTIPIEGWLLAAGDAPGLGRRFGLERWASFDDSLARTLAALREEARGRRSENGPDVLGSDVDETAITVARHNARAARARTRFLVRPVSALPPTGPASTVIVNPPYGERLAAGEALYREMAQALRLLRGHAVHVLAGSRAIEEAMGMRPAKRHEIWNGPIACRLLSYEI
jgi:putative N6-adenine-specific DNA methylase